MTLQEENFFYGDVLGRLSSMEAFDMPGAIDKKRDAELLARIDFARAALKTIREDK